MVKISKYVFILLSLVLMLSACQSTPDTQIIVDKIDDAIDDAVTESSSPSTDPLSEDIAESYKAPELWQEEYTLPYFTFHINARINIPEMTQFPILSVKSRMLTAEDALAFISDIVKDAISFSPNIKTKAELEKELMYAKLGIINPDTGEYGPYPGQAEEIAALERQIAEAPEKLPVYDIASFKLTELPASFYFQYSDGRSVETVLFEQGIKINLSGNDILQPERWVIGGNNITGEPAGTTLQNIKITDEEAIEIGRIAIETYSFQNLGLISIEKARLYDSTQHKNTSEGWVLTYGRNDYGYLPFDLSRCADPLTASDEYYSPLETEKLQIYIDEKGVQRLTWSNPWDIAEEPVLQGANLLPFDEIQERIRNQLSFEWSWIDSENPYFSLDQNVYDLTLTYCLTPMKNNIEQALLIPAWICRYKMVVEADNQSLLYNIVAISAIDGARVSPMMNWNDEE